MKDRISRIREILASAAPGRADRGAGARAARGFEPRQQRAAPKRRPRRWRQARIDAIVDRCVRHGLGVRMADLIAARYGAVVLAELTDAQLQQVYRVVARWAMAVSTAFKDSAGAW